MRVSVPTRMMMAMRMTAGQHQQGRSTVGGSQAKSEFFQRPPTRTVSLSIDRF